MPLIPMRGQEGRRKGTERETVLSWLESRLRTSIERRDELKDYDPTGLLPGYESVVEDMLELKGELESKGFMYCFNPTALRKAKE